MAMRVLLISRGDATISSVERALHDSGCSVQVETPSTGKEAREDLDEYAVLVLDVDNAASGIESIERLRSAGRTVPILLLARNGTEEQFVQALDAGADGSLRRPIAPAELCARLHALSRRTGPIRLDHLTYGELKMDWVHRVAWCRGRPLDLTSKEFQILEYMLLHQNAVVRRTELIEKVWNARHDPSSNVIAAHVRNLRRKLERHGLPSLIRTVRGVGYMLGRAA